jgi:anti-sigma B factor antagonist
MDACSLANVGAVARSLDSSPADPPALSVRVLSTGDRSLRVLVRGELDLLTSPKFETAVTGALGEADEVVVDLSQVTFIDSAGLSSILSTVSTSQLNGSRLTISSTLAPQARRVFELAGMDATLPLVDE